VTELEDKASRRAQRREQQKNASGEVTSSQEKPSRLESAEGPDEPGSDEGAEPESIGEGKPVREIRDRNAKIRAQAAEERRAKRERERTAVAMPSGLDAAERMDDIFVRTTHASATWVRKNFKWMQWVVILGVAGGFSVQVYRYVSRSKAAKSTDALAVGVTAEGGTVRPEKGEEQGNNPEFSKLDPRPVYETPQAKLAAAEEGYRKAMSGHSNSGAGWVARLGLAGVLYDQKKWDDALLQYRAVRASDVAKLDGDVLGRSIEGIGLTLEAKGDRAGALTAYRELTNQEQAPWLSTLGLYHQARMLLADGNKDKAKELAAKAKERLDKDAKERGEGTEKGAPSKPGYLSESLKMLMAQIDPNSASSSSGRDINDALMNDPAKLQKLIDDMQKQAPASAPAAPAAPGGHP